MQSQTPQHRPATTEQVPEKMTQSTYVAFCINVIHSLTQFCLGGIVITATFAQVFLHPNSTIPSKQHIILCTVGYFVLMAQAILAISPFGFASNLKYEKKKMTHAIMQIAGSALAIAGGTIQLLNHGTWTSIHGFFGILALAFTVASLIGGVVNFIMSRKEQNRLVTILHSCLGTITIILAYLTVILGFAVYYRYRVGQTQMNVGIGLGCFALIGTVIITLTTNFKRILNR